MDFRTFIEQALNQASDIASKSFGRVSGVVKPDDNNQVLTQTDLDIGHLLVNLIKNQYPNHNIIDEEAGVINRSSEYTWVIDPIDGTSNFAHGLPLYGIFLGLLQKGIPITGGISLPAFSEIYLAQKGKGAFCNGVRSRISRENKLRNALVAYGIDGHQENPQTTMAECQLLAEIILSIRNLRGSNSAFDAAMLAKGKYEAYLNQTSKIWDNVAQQIVIEEAGGVYTDFFGRQMDYSDPLNKVQDNFTFCTANPEIHRQIQQIISSHTTS